jgi:hypothetical protein
MKHHTMNMYEERDEYLHAVLIKLRTRQKWGTASHSGCITPEETTYGR